MQVIITNTYVLLLLGVLLVGLLAVPLFFARTIARYAIDKITDGIVARILKEDYSQNIAELYSSLKRFSLLNLLEMSLRAETGKVIGRPLGSPKHFFGYDNLMFSPRQMTQISLQANAKIDMSVTLGTKAKKPMTINIPLMIGGMAYGLALSEEAKIALARASKVLKTAANSGVGPYLPGEAEQSGRFVLQICCWDWGARTDKEIASAHMLEVQMGQGADVGSAPMEADEFEGKARVLTGLAPGQPAVSLPAPPGIRMLEDWPGFMQNLRQRANGMPIALKLMATDRLEEDLDVAIKLDFDAIVIDGVEGGSHASPPIKQDDFGIPSLHALVRAKRHLKDSSMSVIVGGGYFTPGQCLKALALGADAIYLGTVPLFALTHNQITKVTPWEPPTTLVYYNSPTKTQLDVEQAATSVTNVLKSMVLEMEEAMRALGKRTIKELGPDDLVALDEVTAKVTGVKLVYQDAKEAIQMPGQGKVDTQEQASIERHLHILRQLENEMLELRKGLMQLYQDVTSHKRIDRN